MISPWTAIIVHIVIAIKELLVIAGFISLIFIIVGIAMLDLKVDNITGIAGIGKKLIAGSCMAIALAVSAHVLIPPSAALARVLVVQQLPEDADIEVVDELVYRVCKEATGK